MGLKNKTIAKAFLRERYKKSKKRKIAHDVAYVTDWDIMFNGVFQTSQVGCGDLMSKIQANFIKDMNQLKEMHLQDGAKVREVLFLLTYRETRSGYMARKKKTTDERTKNGFSAAETAERGPFDTWKPVSPEEDDRARHTSAYKIWCFEQTFKAFEAQLAADLKAKTITDSLGIERIHFVGFQGTYSVYDTDGNVQTYMMTGAGEADVHFYNIPEFEALQKKFCIVLKSTDTDAFVIGTSLPRAWTFEHGFFLDNGLYQKARSETEPAKYLWLDMKKARDDTSVDWSLFGLCCVLSGTDYSHTICTSSDMLGYMARIRHERAICPDQPLLAFINNKIEAMPVKVPRKRRDGSSPPPKPRPEADDVVWNLEYWKNDYS